MLYRITLDMFESIKNFFRGIAFNANAFYTLILFCILFIITFIIPGLYLLIRKHTLNYKSTGTITDSLCQPSDTKENSYACNLTINYPANDRTYTGVNVDSNTDSTNIYSKGSTIPVYYDKNHPRTFIINQYRYKTIGIVLLVVGFILITMSLISYSLKYRKEINNNLI